MLPVLSVIRLSTSFYSNILLSPWNTSPTEPILSIPKYDPPPQDGFSVAPAALQRFLLTHCPCSLYDSPATITSLPHGLTATVIPPFAPVACTGPRSHNGPSPRPFRFPHIYFSFGRMTLFPYDWHSSLAPTWQGCSSSPPRTSPSACPPCYWSTLTVPVRARSAWLSPQLVGQITPITRLILEIPPDLAHFHISYHHNRPGVKLLLNSLATPWLDLDNLLRERYAITFTPMAQQFLIQISPLSRRQSGIGASLHWVLGAASRAHFLNNCSLQANNSVCVLTGMAPLQCKLFNDVDHAGPVHSGPGHCPHLHESQLRASLPLHYCSEHPVLAQQTSQHRGCS
jgi:hypothetical protein